MKVVKIIEIPMDLPSYSSVEIQDSGWFLFFDGLLSDILSKPTQLTIVTTVTLICRRGDTV